MVEDSEIDFNRLILKAQNLLDLLKNSSVDEATLSAFAIKLVFKNAVIEKQFSILVQCNWDIITTSRSTLNSNDNISDKDFYALASKYIFPYPVSKIDYKPGMNELRFDFNNTFLNIKPLEDDVWTFFYFENQNEYWLTFYENKIVEND